jgi:hypothetical protein
MRQKRPIYAAKETYYTGKTGLFTHWHTYQVLLHLGAVEGKLFTPWGIAAALSGKKNSKKKCKRPLPHGVSPPPWQEKKRSKDALKNKSQKTPACVAKRPCIEIIEAWQEE